MKFLRAFPIWGLIIALTLALGLTGLRLRSSDDASPTQHTAATAKPREFRVVKSYPHDTSAFTQGLLWHNGNLIEGTGREGHSELRRVDLTTGKVLQRQKLPSDVFGEGVALAYERFIQLSWQNGRAFVFDEKTFDKLHEWKYDGEGWGLTFDGKQLIMSDGSDKLTFRDSKTFAPINTLAVTFNGKPLDRLNELEWIEGKIWANVWQTDYIVIINPTTGIVEQYLDCTNLLGTGSRSGREDVLNGIAYDQKTGRIFITGKWWPCLFEIALN
jgi:glutamine cyclotransferase